MARWTDTRRSPAIELTDSMSSDPATTTKTSSFGVDLVLDGLERLLG
jgi:hypothetical protein